MPPKENIGKQNQDSSQGGDWLADLSSNKPPALIYVNSTNMHKVFGTSNHHRLLEEHLCLKISNPQQTPSPQNALREISGDIPAENYIRGTQGAPLESITAEYLRLDQIKKQTFLFGFSDAFKGAYDNFLVNLKLYGWAGLEGLTGEEWRNKQPRLNSWFLGGEIWLPGETRRNVIEESTDIFQVVESIRRITDNLDEFLDIVKSYPIG